MHVPAAGIILCSNIIILCGFMTTQLLGACYRPKITTVIGAYFRKMRRVSLAWPDRYIFTGRLSLSVKAPIKNRVWSRSYCLVILDTSELTGRVKMLVKASTALIDGLRI